MTISDNTIQNLESLKINTRFKSLNFVWDIKLNDSSRPVVGVHKWLLIAVHGVNTALPISENFDAVALVFVNWHRTNENEIFARF